VTAPTPAGRARLLRYAPYQLRDYLVERGLPTLVAASPMLILMVTETRQEMARGAPDEQMRLVTLVGLATLFTQLLGFVIVLLATNGIVANDRKLGYYRFLFAKPASIPRYYAQTFVVHGVGAVLSAAAITGLFALVLHPVFPPGVLTFVALYYLMLGGLAFFLSTVTTLDWVTVAGVWALSSVLRVVYPAAESWYGRLFDVVLPPTHALADLGRSMIIGPQSPTVTEALARAGQLSARGTSPADVLWVAGWGVGAFVAGLLVLRHRSIAY
jgi:hypothetical protein